MRIYLALIWKYQWKPEVIASLITKEVKIKELFLAD